MLPLEFIIVSCLNVLQESNDAWSAGNGGVKGLVILINCELEL
jgi:hypothetical protein